MSFPLFSSLHTAPCNRAYRSASVNASFGSSTFAALFSRRCAMAGLISVSSTPRCRPSTCWSIGRSSGGAPRPSSFASSMSNVDTAIRRRNAGGKLKLSVDSTSFASMSSAARCLAASTGISGWRPLPARSRSVVRPPTYFDA